MARSKHRFANLPAVLSPPPGLRAITSPDRSRPTAAPQPAPHTRNGASIHATTTRGQQGGTILRDLFGIDLRGLAVFRIGLGLLILVDLCNRSRDLVAHYTDEGILPRSARLLFFESNASSSYRYWWSLHMMGGNAWSQALLFAIAAAAAACLLVGYRTKLATIVSWLLLVSLHSRNPMLLNGGDVMLRCILFWAMFLPLGAALSIDRRRTHGPVSRATHALSIATAALLLQVCAVYWFGAALKTGLAWTVDHSAIHYALNLDFMRTGFGRILLDYPNLLPLMTVAVYWLELLGPLAVFLPVGGGWLRLLVVLMFWGFHIGLELTMHFGMFQYVALLAWVPFLPSGFWDRIGASGARLWNAAVACIAPELGRSQHSPAARSNLPATGKCIGLGWIPSIVAGLMLVYIALWNVRSLDAKYWGPKLLPGNWSVIGHVTRMNQNWSMFAPNPSKADGWFVFRGVLRNGEEVNLWSPGSALPLSKPELVSADYPNHRWRKFISQLRTRRQRGHRKYFALWLRRNYEAQAAIAAPDERVRTIEIIYMLERTPPPGMDPLPPKRVRLWAGRFR